MIGIAGWNEHVEVKDGPTSEITDKTGPSHENSIRNYEKTLFNKYNISSHFDFFSSCIKLIIFIASPV